MKQVVGELERMRSEYLDEREIIAGLLERGVIDPTLMEYLNGICDLDNFGKLAVIFWEFDKIEDSIESLTHCKMCLDKISITLMGLRGSQAEKREGDIVYYTGPKLVEAIGKIDDSTKDLFYLAEEIYNKYQTKLEEGYKAKLKKAVSN